MRTDSSTIMSNDRTAIYESLFKTDDFNYRLEFSFDFEVSDDRLKIHLSLLHAA